ncbi:hypothetical protein AX16_000953 [Volvariella volvacea WC 439]|nr:hypothetical protein AX16_000953 [Volvariella volvacea WC 439]
MDIILHLLPLDPWGRKVHLSITSNDSSPVVLAHYRYLATLPSRDKLRTPLYFTPEELQLFRGTNLFGAALDKEREWKDEWTQCRRLVGKLNPAWGQAYTWDYYLSAATYLSSRAFPSSLLSPAPTLEYSPSTEPVLIPGVDALNHARGEPVSWSVIYPDGSPERHPKRPYIALVHHNPVRSGQEIFNNYGAKPNSELILGYGFALPHNPEDTIVLKIGGIADGQKWEVGRNAANAEGLWNEILTTVSDPAYAEYENMLDSAGMLTEMVQTQLDRLPQESELDVPPDGVHPEVVTMLHHYLKGQREILEDVMQFASTKEQAAVELARSQGIDVVLDD